jgi:hypothetical protein
MSENKRRSTMQTLSFLFFLTVFTIAIAMMITMITTYGQRILQALAGAPTGAVHSANFGNVRSFERARAKTRDMSAPNRLEAAPLPLAA